MKSPGNVKIYRLEYRDGIMGTFMVVSMQKYLSDNALLLIFALVICFYSFSCLWDLEVYIILQRWVRYYTLSENALGIFSLWD